MAFRPPKKRPRFADLLVILAQTKEIDDALYQTVQEIINRLDQFSTVTGEQIASGGGGGGIGGGAVAPHAPTHYSSGTDPVVVTNLAGYLGDITKFLRSDGTFQIPPGGTGGGTTPSAHATTHEPGGSDTMAVDAIPATGSLRTLGSGPNQAVSGNDSRLTNARTPTVHAPTHSQGGTDAVDVKNLTGYPGGTTTFLRADKTFAAPPGGGGMNLDYLGNYVSGPVYNDGDIVIASDNVAYMCVVDGTTTPPEPWPGVGIATAVGPPGPPGPTGPQGPAGTGAGTDATYWTVTPDATLTHERAMNSLANGYVRSTAGEPSTVATIPFSDTTGIVPDARLSANVALKNIDNLFVAQTFPSYTTIKGANSIFFFNDTAAPLNMKLWRFVSYGSGYLYLESLSDDQSTITSQFYFGRNGYMGGVGFIGDGANLTGLNASNLAVGTVATARLGGGVANYTTYLRGDQVWAPITDIFPSGLIVLSVSPCPIGWTRVVWDGNFIRVGPTPGVAGGAWDHVHGPGSYAVNSHNHGGSVSVSISGGTSNDGNHIHGYGGTIGGTTSGGDSQSLNVDGGSSGVMSRVAHTHTFNANFSGDTDSRGAHSHSFSGSGSGGIGAEAPGVNGTSAAAQHLPPFIDVFLCQKN